MRVMSNTRHCVVVVGFVSDFCAPLQSCTPKFVAAPKSHSDESRSEVTMLAATLRTANKQLATLAISTAAPCSLQLC